MYETNAKTQSLVIKNATFITSAARAEQFIKPDKPVIAVCGKSNVGKSSFINMLANRKKLAKTSSEPGRTRLVNYFDFGEFILADLPGYGFARVSKAEKDKWAKTLDAFFRNKNGIAHVFMLADSRHDPTEDDVQMMQFLHYHTLPFTVVLTKADKLSKMKLKEHIRAIAADLYLGVENLIATSAETGYGKDDVLKKLRFVIDRASEPAYEEEEEGEDGEEKEE
ncbi:MAG: YihA family ribosome biogenesis GTP-binding protein [Clostridia bacterium]|nr:YihA family ribosome biogenesis GTP-binding protein [Clostridia bacterium]